MIFSPSKNRQAQAGQTLIETLVAAFILIMGISAALGLATYSLSVTGKIKQQTIAIGLAREGIEVIKNMRDTNWLQGIKSSDCYDFLPPHSLTTYCYRDWLSAVYNIDPGSDTDPDGQNLFVPLPVPTVNTKEYSLSYNQGSETPWALGVIGGYGLDLSTDTSADGIYYYPGAGNSGFYRKIIITSEDFEPFDRDEGPRLTVTSKVWWWGKNCPSVTDVADTDTNPCMVTLKTYLTNWRNF